MGKKVQKRPRTISLGLSSPPEGTLGLALRRSDLAPFWVGEKRMEPASASWMGYGFDRAKGPKFLYRSTDFSAELGLDPNKQILKFPNVIAVDTNTRLISGSRVSVSAAVSMRVDEVNGGRARVGVAHLYAMELWNTPADAEAIGWELLVDLIQREKLFFRWPILILTDYKLDKHEKINNRSEPLRGDTYLPPGIHMGYASSDSGGELISTKLIRAADKLASRVMMEGNILLNCSDLHFCDGEDFSHFRQWGSDDLCFDV